MTLSPLTSTPTVCSQDFKTKASQAMLRRLVTCLVNENLVLAQLIDVCQVPLQLLKSIKIEFKYWCKLTNPNVDGAVKDEEGEGFYFGLVNLPIYAQAKECNKYKVLFLDSEDITFPLTHHSPTTNSIFELSDASLLLSKVGEWNGLNSKVVSLILEELESCVVHQEYSYKSRRPLPTFDSPSIDWEQSITEGHPTHPMHRTRHAVAPIEPISLEDDLLTPKVRIFIVRKDQVILYGKFESLLAPLFRGLDIDYDNEKETLVPVHELQINNILEKFPDARLITNLVFTSKAQCALRTVEIESLEHVIVKLALGIKVTSTLRCISPYGTFIGPNALEIVDRVVDDKNKLVVVNEVASVQVLHANMDLAKHFSCILRENVDLKCTGEKVIVCAALTEISENGTYVLPTLLGLRYEEERVKFFELYCKLLLECFITPILNYGFAFEAHLQNTMARFKYDNATGKYILVGFAIRDIGGIKCDLKKLFRTTGLTLKTFDKDAYQVAKDTEDLLQVAYHTIVQMHLHRVIRALGLHYNGRGWDIVRGKLEEMLQGDESGVKEYFLKAEQVDWKCFLSMKLKDLYKDLLFAKIPNLVQYTPPTPPKF